MHNINVLVIANRRTTIPKISLSKKIFDIPLLDHKNKTNIKSLVLTIVKLNDYENSNNNND